MLQFINDYIKASAKEHKSTTTHPLLEAEVSANKRERDGDAKPLYKESNNGREGDRCTATFAPQDQIQ